MLGTFFRVDGSVACWGDNFHGELGAGTKHDRRDAVLVKGVEGAVEVQAGLTYACARLENGHVECWGSTPMSTYVPAKDRATSYMSKLPLPAG